MVGLYGNVDPLAISPFYSLLPVWIGAHPVIRPAVVAAIQRAFLPGSGVWPAGGWGLNVFTSSSRNQKVFLR